MSSPPGSGALLTDVAGRITHVLQALPAEDPEAVPRLMECQHAVRTALGPATRYTVLLHPEHEAGVRAQFGAEEESRFVRWSRPRTLRAAAGGAILDGATLRAGTVAGWNDFTPWVQDAFLVRTGIPVPTLLTTPGIRRPHGSRDEEVASVVAEALGWPCEPLACGLEASNVLTDGERVLIGADVVSELPGATRSALLGQLGGAERIAVVPRAGSQPIPHQDLYVTLAGTTDRGPLAMVGSPRVAAEVRGVSLGRDDADTNFDDVARDLERLGYLVARLPLEPHMEGSVERGWTTYNNALVEVVEPIGSRPIRRVILPAYGTDGGPALRDLDTAAAEIWKTWDFDVCLAEGPFDWLAARAGSVRCLTKVLERE